VPPPYVELQLIQREIGGCVHPVAQTAPVGLMSISESVRPRPAKVARIKPMLFPRCIDFEQSIGRFTVTRTSERIDATESRIAKRVTGYEDVFRKQSTATPLPVGEFVPPPTWWNPK